jgi:DNA-binding NarL/FixJ family response regulator
MQVLGGGMTGVLVVEDQQVLASALEVAIGTQPDLDCLGTAATVDDALAQIDARHPDVVLMDIELPGTDGIEGTRLIKAAHPDVTVLVLTGGATPERLAAAATAGAGGFLAKDTSFPELLAAIRCPMPSKVVVEGEVLHDLIDRSPAAPRPPRHETAAHRTAADGPDAAGKPVAGDERGLTAREFEVLGLMGQGLDPAAIAERLIVSVHTARGHVKNVMMKLGAHTQLEAVVIATRLGLLTHVQDTDWGGEHDGDQRLPSGSDTG